MKFKLNQGFTLIELLVVIAIIGILASVVLASLNTARDRGADAAAMANLNNIRAQAELVFSDVNPNSYATVCANANVTAGTLAATNAVPGETSVCFDTDDAWAAGITLTDSPEFYCVDSTGFGGVLAANPILSNTNLTCN